jgi:iron complex transport system substrate-binding protein
MSLHRRRFALGAFSLSVASVAPRAAFSQTLTDAAKRPIPVPPEVRRVFPAGPPAAILLYTLAPDLLLGWPRANRPEEREFLLPEVGARPELGRLTGRGNTTNLELLLAARPDLILDAGTINDTSVSLAERVQAQTGIPYALLDGSFAGTPGAYRTLGELLHRKERAEELAASCETTIRTVLGRIHDIPDDGRPRVYYARGPRGLETGLGGSINVETIEVLRARNVAGEVRGGLATVSLEQVLAWAPEVIVTIDADFYANLRSDPAWSGVPAVRSGRVHLSPKLPFGWVDFPPSVNRFIGLWWLAKILYPDRFREDLKPIARDFYTRFYHVTPTDAEMDRVLAGRG